MGLFCRYLAVFAALLWAMNTVAQPFARAAPTPKPASLPVPPPPDVDAQSYVLMDGATGQILASRHPDKRHPPASLTKLMTEYVVASEIAAGRIHLDDPVTISQHAWRAGGAGTDGATSFLKMGSTV